MGTQKRQRERGRRHSRDMPSQSWSACAALGEVSKTVGWAFLTRITLRLWAGPFSSRKSSPSKKWVPVPRPPSQGCVESPKVGDADGG